jgi:PBP superfamily domain
VDRAGRAMRARGNEGVAALIKISEGSIGYVEYAYAMRLGLPMAMLQNKAGRYVAPNDRSGQAALASNVKQMPDNLRLFMPDPDGEDSYTSNARRWIRCGRNCTSGQSTSSRTRERSPQTSADGSPSFVKSVTGLSTGVTPLTTTHFGPSTLGFGCCLH